MADDFEIRVGDEIRDNLRLEEPKLLQSQHKVWGHPEADTTRIILSQIAYNKINHHARSAPSQEVGGVLLGDVYRHEGIIYVEIVEALAAKMTQAGATHLTFTPDTWASVRHDQEHHFPNLKIVGWYHTHPRMEVFLSGTDVFSHQHFFPEPWQVALVTEPHKHHGGFFIWKEGTITPASGFYEAFDTTPKSIINWRNIGVAPSPSVLSVEQTNTPVFRRSTSTLVVLMGFGILALLILLLGLLSMQTRQTVSRLNNQFVAAEATVSSLGVQVAMLSQQITDATTTARSAQETQTARANATAQARVAQRATQTAATATARARSTSLSVQATQTAQALQPAVTTSEVLTATGEAQVGSAPAVTSTLTSASSVTATATVEALATASVTDTTTILSQTASPESTAAVTDTTPVEATRVPPTAVFTTSLVVSQGMTLTQDNQEIGDGGRIALGMPVTFTFTLQNVGTVPLPLSAIGIGLIQGDKVEMLTHVATEPLVISPGGQHNDMFTYFFSERGQYTVFVSAYSRNLGPETPAEVSAILGASSRLTIDVD